MQGRWENEVEDGEEIDELPEQLNIQVEVGPEAGTAIRSQRISRQTEFFGDPSLGEFEDAYLE